MNFERPNLLPAGTKKLFRGVFATIFFLRSLDSTNLPLQYDHNLGPQFSDILRKVIGFKAEMYRATPESLLFPTQGFPQLNRPRNETGTVKKFYFYSHRFYEF